MEKLYGSVNGKQVRIYPLERWIDGRYDREITYTAESIEQNAPDWLKADQKPLSEQDVSNSHDLKFKMGDYEIFWPKGTPSRCYWIYETYMKIKRKEKLEAI